MIHKYVNPYIRKRYDTYIVCEDVVSKDKKAYCTLTTRFLTYSIPFKDTGIIDYRNGNSTRS